MTSVQKKMRPHLVFLSAQCTKSFKIWNESRLYLKVKSPSPMFPRKCWIKVKDKEAVTWQVRGWPTHTLYWHAHTVPPLRCVCRLRTEAPVYSFQAEFDVQMGWVNIWSPENRSRTRHPSPCKVWDKLHRRHNNRNYPRSRGSAKMTENALINAKMAARHSLSKLSSSFHFDIVLWHPDAARWHQSTAFVPNEA